jgi:2-dehydropantoate 2-reductase
MKVCVAGLGAVGGLVAARLALAGCEVSALARGATLAAVRERGLALTTSQGERTSRASMPRIQPLRCRCPNS